MADKKISELTNITGANLADTDEFVVVDTSASETKAITYGELKKINGNLSFADNDKAIFGASGDLQIYHDGFNSYIKDLGTGDLILTGNVGVQLQSDAGENMITTTANGAVSLFYDASPKLATTSTGVDVTGTVTADGLTVSNTSVVAGDFDGGTAATYIRLQDDTDNFFIGTNNGLGSFLIKNETADALRLTVGRNGDISFYEDTGTTPKFFWDASAESLGIGTSLPAAKLDVATTTQFTFSAASTAGVKIGTQGTAGGSFMVQTPSLSDTFGSGLAIDGSYSGGKSTINLKAFGVYSGGPYSSDLAFYTSTNTTLSEKMRLDNSGNLGIGTSSPAKLLSIRQPADQNGIRINHASRATSTFWDVELSGVSNEGLAFKQNDGSTTVTSYVAGRDQHLFYTGGSERMRIDASGNLQVGTTQTFPAFNNVVGCEVGGFGQISASRDGAEAMQLNRKTSDGNIAIFRKDGATVGSIGSSNSGYNLFITTSDTGLAFNYLADEIVPCTANGAYRDGAIDLGDGNARFKDLYLSGGVYLGGTGAANLLDDYEEGTFTATLKGSTGEPATLITANYAKYTKVGDTVFIEISYENVNTTGYSGDISIDTLPFTSGTGRSVLNVAHYQTSSWGTTDIPIALIGGSTTTVSFLNYSSGTTWQTTTHSAGSGRYLWITGTYKV